MAKKKHQPPPGVEKLLDWEFHEPWHWSAMLDGARIDYWPTKRKWNHWGEIKTGDVVAYIRAHKEGEEDHIADAFIFMSAEQQARCITRIFVKARQFNSPPREERFQWQEIGKHVEPRIKVLLLRLARLIAGKEHWRYGVYNPPAKDRPKPKAQEGEAPGTADH